jgi:hypothetical protein
MPNRPPLTIARQRLWKPTFPGDQPRVNWAHPLARGLTHLYLLTDAARTVYNLAKLNDGGGSLQATVKKGSTPAGPGLTFDGSASHNLTLTKGLVVTGVDFSSEIFFKVTSLPSSGFSFDMLSGPAESNGLLVTNGGTNTVLAFDTDLTGSLSNTVLAINTWYHAIMTCTGGGSGNVYINGKADTANPLSVTGNQTNALTNIGGSSSQGFPGTIGWFRHWSRVLSQAEALQLYVDPWAMLYDTGQMRRTIAIMGGSPASGGSNAIAGQANGTGAATSLQIGVDRIAGTTSGAGAATALTIGKDEIAGTASGVGVASLSLITEPANEFTAIGTGAGTSLQIGADEIAGKTAGDGSATALTIRKDQIAAAAVGTGAATALTLTVGTPSVAIQGTASGVGVASLTLTVSITISGQANGSGSLTTLAILVGRAISGQASGSGAATSFTLLVTQLLSGKASGIGLAQLSLTVGVVAIPGAVYVSDGRLWACVVSDVRLYGCVVSDVPLGRVALSDELVH